MKKKLIPISIFFIFSPFIAAMLKDLIIIYAGIRIFNTLMIILYCAAVFGFFAISASIFLVVKKSKELMLEEEKQLKEKAEKEAEQQSAGFSTEVLQKRMQRVSEETQNEDAYMIFQQLQEIDEMQDKLDTLLENNNADALNNTKEVLVQVEQYICKNTQNVLNYFDILDWNDNREKLEAELKTCRTNNEVQLKKTQELLIALTEFLNNQGQTNSIETLEIYKQTILRALGKEI